MTALSTSHTLRERVSSTTNASVSATRKSNFIHQHRNRHRAVGVRSTAASEDDYNAAMKAYSETPYEYKHELGLCKCAENTVARFFALRRSSLCWKKRFSHSDGSLGRLDDD